MNKHILKEYLSPLVESSLMKKLDQDTIESLNITTKELMYQAAYSIFEHIKDLDFDKVLILAGFSNNAGDGFVLANLLDAINKEVSLSLLLDKKLSDDAKYYYDKLKNINLINKEDIKDYLYKSNKLLIIDAVFGIGYKGDLPLDIQEIFKNINSTDFYKIAIDIPSGINPNTGQISPNAFVADKVFTFECLKPGLVSQPAKSLINELKVINIGLLKDNLITSYYLINNDIKNYIDKPRNSLSHKYVYGKILNYSGSRKMTGACYLSTMGSYRSGVGLVEILCDECILNVLQIKMNEPIFLPYHNKEELFNNLNNLNNYNAILVGPGSSEELLSIEIIKYLINNTINPIVIDATALNIISNDLSILSQNKAIKVLTPHTGEMARLTKLTSKEIASNRIEIAKTFAMKYQVYLVLKGDATVVCSPYGIVAINSSGNPGMAKAGTGDILAGMITGYLSQVKDLNNEDEIFIAICAAVYHHGFLADKVSNYLSYREMIASDFLK